MIDDEALWQEFAAESEEHLDAIERLLGGDATERSAIDALFRAFHSLKGMTGALGAAGMGAIAHRCEDLLGLARQGTLAVSGEVAGGLLAAVDVLRRQRGEVLRDRGDSPAPGALLTRLAALAPGPGRGTESLPRAAGPEPTGRSPLLASFASACADAAPQLATLPFMPDDAARGVATDLAASAEGLGLSRLADILRQSAAPPAGQALRVMGRLRRLLLVLQGECGEDAGGDALGTAVLSRAGDGVLRPLLAALAVQVEELAAGGAGASATASAAREAGAMAAALGLDGLEQAMLALEDLADRSAEPDAAAILAVEAPAIADRLRRGAEDRLSVLADLALPDTPGITDEDEARALARVPPELARLLGAVGRGRLREGLAAGHHLYRARLGVPATNLEEGRVQAWLGEHDARVLTSRTILDSVPPSLDLLFVAPADNEVLQASRAQLDPDGRLVMALAPVREQSTASHPGDTGSTIRVRQQVIDGIIALEAEMRAAALGLSEALAEDNHRNVADAITTVARRVTGDPGQELLGLAERMRRLQTRLDEAEGRLTIAMRRLDEEVLELRVVPIAGLFNRLPRVARSVAQASGKEVEIVLDGEEVRIDRGLVEILVDPLLHLVRNAVDHGIESPALRAAAGKQACARVSVSAERRAGHVRIGVSDDGAGIDLDAVRGAAIAGGLLSEAEAPHMDDAGLHALLFRPGFSTSERVSETSGRGVGLDVVHDAVRRAGGALEVTSRRGEGTTFSLSLPLSAAMAPVLIVEAGGHPYALPAARVEAVLDGDAEAPGPTLSLASVLGLGAEESGGIIVLRRSTGRPLLLSVGRVQRRTDLLLRPLHPSLAALPGVAGVGVLGTGEPVVLLEPDGLG